MNTNMNNKITFKKLNNNLNEYNLIKLIFKKSFGERKFTIIQEKEIKNILINDYNEIHNKIDQLFYDLRQIYLLNDFMEFIYSVSYRMIFQEKHKNIKDLITRFILQYKLFNKEYLKYFESKGLFNKFFFTNHFKTCDYYIRHPVIKKSYITQNVLTKELFWKLKDFLIMADLRNFMNRNNIRYKEVKIDWTIYYRPIE